MKSFYEYQIAVFIDGIESISESLIIKNRKQITVTDAKSRLCNLISSKGFFCDDASHIQLRDGDGKPLSEIWRLPE